VATNLGVFIAKKEETAMSCKRLAISLIILTITALANAEGVFTPPIATVRYVPRSSHVLRVQCGAQTIPIPYEVFTQQPCARGFIKFGNNGLPAQQTELRLAYDADNLYVVFSGAEQLKWTTSLASESRDVPAWRNESVELFLDPKMDGETYLHLIADVSGGTFDATGDSSDGKSWDGKWMTVPLTSNRGWNIAVVIPFKSFGVERPKPGETWAANFGRHALSANEFSTWSPVGREFNEPWRFGHITFADASSVIASAPLSEISLPGKHQLTLYVSNLSKGPIRLRAEGVIDGKSFPLKTTELLPGQHELKVSMDIPDGKHDLSLALVEAAGERIIFRSAPLRVDILPNLTRLAEFRKVITRIKPPNKELRAQLESLKRSIARLTTSARTAVKSVEEWSALSQKLDNVEKEIARLLYVCLDKEGCGFVLAAENALTKVFRDKLLAVNPGEPVTISMARKEFESAQVLILAHKPLHDVMVSVSDLKGPGEAIIPKESVKLELVGYVRTYKPRYDVDYVGWWPDPLLEMRKFDVPAMTIQPVWITVYTPENIPAGDYQGQVIVKSSSGQSCSIPIKVHVWDFTLPTSMHLKTAFALFPHEIAAWYGGMTEEIKRRYYEFLLEHRLNPTNIYSGVPVPSREDLPWCVERGLNAFCLAYTHNRNEKGRRELAQMIRAYREFLKEKGWWDKAYIYGFDEVKPDKYAELRDMYAWIKSEFPDLPRMCTVVPNEELRGFVDIWVPLISNFRPRKAAEYVKKGDQVWWYVCCVPPHPFPNFFIDYPAIDPRIVFWMNWKYQVPGFLYYALNNWTTNREVAGLPGEHRPHPDPEAAQAIKDGKRWPEVSWNTYTFDDYNGDGQLIYPGPNGVPFSSIRLECIRDGIEDYEYFCILEDLLAKHSTHADPAVTARAKEVLAVRDAVVKSPTEYTLDPHLLLSARAEIAELTEKLSKP